MKSSTQNIIIFIVVFVLTIAALYGVRQWRMNRAVQADYDLSTGLLQESVRYGGEDYLLPPGEIYEVGLGVDSIPAITNPVFTTVDDADTYLSDEVQGIDIVVNGEHRFYSYQILNWHYVVQDEFNGEKLLITHCPLCFSSAAYKAELNGELISLSASNNVYNNNAILTDSETESLWLQATGVAISGEKIGSQLELYPSTVISWGNWKQLYPYGEVLSTETGYSRDYARHPYTSYDTAETIYFPLNTTTEMLGAKWSITGTVLEGGPIAFADTILKGTGVANEQVGDKRVVAFYNAATTETFILNPDIEGYELTFSYDFDKRIITDDQTGSQWLASGLAISGELSGTELERIPSSHSFWFCWYALHPDTLMSGVDLHPEQIELDVEGESIEVEI